MGGWMGEWMARVVESEWKGKLDGWKEEMNG